MKTICIVDDTPELLLNLSEFLQMEGFSVVPLEGGKEALHYLETSVPDLLITDLWMPPTDGLVLIEKIRERKELTNTPIIIFSAKPISDYESKAKTLGVYNFIKKPAAPEKILQEIHLLLRNDYDQKNQSSDY